MNLHSQAATAEANMTQAMKIEAAASFSQMKDQALALASLIDAVGVLAEQLLEIRGMFRAPAPPKPGAPPAARA